jgi:hypothetical protein
LLSDVSVPQVIALSESLLRPGKRNLGPQNPMSSFQRHKRVSDLSPLPSCPGDWSSRSKLHLPPKQNLIYTLQHKPSSTDCRGLQGLTLYLVSYHSYQRSSGDVLPGTGSTSCTKCKESFLSKPVLSRIKLNDHILHH